MQQRRQVAVIGGGVSGLTTAYYLTHGVADPPEVTVFEAASAVGGKVTTEDLVGAPVDTGPDALLVRAPAASALIAELGLTDRLDAPASSGAYLWSRGVLRPMPSGSVFGVPDKLWPLLRSGLLGPWGFLRAGADLVLPRRAVGPDPSVEQFLRPRLGTQVYDRMIEPMIGGVHAGRASRLSARSSVPELFGLLGGRRSVYLTLRRRPKRAGVAAPALMTLAGGLGTLVTTLRTTLDATAEVQVVTGAEVRRIERDGAGWSVTAGDRPPRRVDDVILATPAHVSARLLEPLAADLAADLAGIPYVGVATITLAYPRQAIGRPLDGTGFLVPPVEGKFLVGCSWLSAKWPHLTGGPLALIRAMVGRDGDQAWAELDDAALVSAVRAELAQAMAVTGEPVATVIRRVPQAMPQYLVGHGDRLARIDAALTDLPGLHLTGAAYRGVGLAGCIGQAKAAAGRVLDRTNEGVSA